MDENGVGPAWAWPWLRRLLTALSAAFFDEAGWRAHDTGYARGDPARALCDLRFLQAMLRDAAQAPRAGRVLACSLLAVVFWILVRAFGWISYRRAGQDPAAKV